MNTALHGFCRHCGQPLPGIGEFCPACGTKTTANRIIPEESPHSSLRQCRRIPGKNTVQAKQGRPHSLAAMVLVAIGLGGLLLLVLYAMTRPVSKLGSQVQAFTAPCQPWMSGPNEQAAAIGLSPWRPFSEWARGGQRPEGCLAPGAWSIETSLHL